jgi:hypothetical protein
MRAENLMFFNLILKTKNLQDCIEILFHKNENNLSI